MNKRFVFLRSTVEWCEGMLSTYALAFESTTEHSASSVRTSEYPRYNVMSDALEWGDEVPLGLLTNGELKQLYTALLNARTTIILHLDENGLCSVLLKLAEKLIPSWTGLLPERRTDKLSDVFLKLRSESAAITERLIEKL